MRRRDFAVMATAVRNKVERAMDARFAYASEADPENDRPLLKACKPAALVNATIESRRVAQRAVVRAEVLEAMLLDAIAELRDTKERMRK